ncbi:hypothetical protein RQCS_60850 (plasmid) [Rhodococcus qingshengii]|nr:hypothetical protein RQCS_60850 [Rhodococcus qingshengii]
MFDAGPDGEELVCREGPWIDPFADVGTGADPEGEAENARYIAEYGKWTMFDADEGSDVSALIGRSVEALTVDAVADDKPVTESSTWAIVVWWRQGETNSSPRCGSGQNSCSRVGIEFFVRSSA